MSEPNTSDIDPDQLPTVDETADLTGRILVDDNGDRIGEIEDVYADSDTGRAEWALVHTGILGVRLHFVPLAGMVHHPDFVQVGYTNDQVRSAPHVDPDGELDEADEQQLYEHYGLPYADAGGEVSPARPSAARRLREPPAAPAEG